MTAAYEPPRRIRADKYVPAERAISEAHRLVEEMPPDVRLTQAGTKLQEAQALVADFVDGIPFGDGYPRPVPEPVRDDLLRAGLVQFVSKWSHVERDGSTHDAKVVGGQMLSDLRSLLAATSPSLPPVAGADTDRDELVPPPPSSARRELPTLPDGAE